MKGELRLRIERGDGGRSKVGKQFVRAPFFLSKVYWEGGMVVVPVGGCTAGLFEGDECEVEVEIGEGAHGVVTTTASQKVFAGRGGGRGGARVVQAVRVGRGAWLEFAPEFVILHAGSALRQETEVRVEEGGGFLWVEMMAPGRTGFGEAMRFREYRSRMELFVGGRRVLRDVVELGEGMAAREILGRMTGTPYVATVVGVLGDAAQGRRGFEGGLGFFQEKDWGGWEGGSFVEDGVFVYRGIFEGSVEMRRAVERVRRGVYEATGKEVVRWRKN